MIPIIVLKIQYQVIYNQSNLSFQTYFEEFIIMHNPQSMQSWQVPFEKITTAFNFVIMFSLYTLVVLSCAIQYLFSSFCYI